MVFSSRLFRRHRITWLLCATVTVLCGLAWHLASDAPAENWLFILRRTELQIQDLLLRKGPPAPVSKDLVFLGIDSQNYEDRYFEDEIAESPVLGNFSKNYPWSREVWAAVVERLIAAGAKTVVFDLLFVSPGPGDDAFARTLQKHEGKVVLAANLTLSEDGRAVLTWPSSTLLDGLKKPEDTVGIVNFFPDADGVIRRLHYELKMRLIAGRNLSLGAQALTQAGYVPATDKDFSPDREVRFNYGGAPGLGYTHHPVYEIFVPSLWANNYKNGAFFKDKIVVVGPAANWTQDSHPTPYGPMFGAEIHLNAMSAVMNRAFIPEPSLPQAWLLIIAAGLAAALLMSATDHAWIRFGGMIAGSAAGALIARQTYNTWAVMPVILTPLIAFNLCGVVCLVQKFFVTFAEKMRTRGILERYVSQNFVRELLDSSDSFEQSLGGVRKDCTMLFSDIRGFTTMTEGDDSHKLVTQLNEYLSEMVECVFARNGTLDKFIGDAVMAVWGNVKVRTPRADAVDAVQCALDMLAGLDKLNPGWVEAGRPALHVGIGINHGEVIVGNMGSPRRKEFTVIGDSVNLASRLEGVTKEYGLSLVIGESVAQLVKDDFVLQPVDLIRVKGKKRPVQVFTVIAPVARPPDAPVREALRLFEAGLTAYREGRFAEARESFVRSAAASAHNKLAGIYVQRCEALIAEPPVGEWDGVFVMHTK
ncbi:MAG TPA: adenylate/guanylate cyclase domain-containing protein [Rariglobus sp.]